MKDFELEVFYSYLKSHKFLQQGCFFLSSFSRKFDLSWAQICTDLLFYAYDGIHQVRTLVFDN